jgi:ligand-binding sensor domain-containing protein
VSPVRARSRVAFAAFVAVVGVAGRAGARQDHDRPDSYALTAWTAEKGLPGGDIFEMSQDLEGYLWLGMTSGLVRLDGSEFAVWGSHGEAPLPGLAVSALVAARNGSLWVGFGDTAGGVSRIRNGRVVGYTEHDGLPKGPLATLLEDRRGAIWAGGRGGLSTFRDERWETVGSGTGFTDAEVYSLYEDRDGTLWVGSAAGVYRRRAGRFEIVDQRARYVQSFAETTDGTLWVTDTHLAVRKLDASDTPVHDPDADAPRASGARIAGDRQAQQGNRGRARDQRRYGPRPHQEHLPEVQRSRPHRGSRGGVEARHHPHWVIPSFNKRGSS